MFDVIDVKPLKGVSLCCISMFQSNIFLSFWHLHVLGMVMVGLYYCKLIHSSSVCVSSSTTRDFNLLLILFYILEALFFITGPRCSVQFGTIGHSLMKHDKHVGTHQKHDCDPICCSHPELRKLGHEGWKTAETKGIYSCFAFNHLIEKVFQIYFWPQYTI